MVMWFLFVMVASLFTAVYYFGNQLIRVSANVFMLYRGLMPVLVLLPFLPWIGIIETWQFYMCCVIQGVVIAFIDNLNYRAMQKWGAEIVSALHPLSIGVVFVLWFIFNPAQIMIFGQHPWQFVCTVLALSGVVYATCSLKKVPEIRKTLWFLLPYFLGAALCDNMNKLCMSYLNEAELLRGSYFYILVTGAVVAVINLIIYMGRNEPLKAIFKKQNLWCGAIMLLGIGSMLFKNLAMFNVSNPAYVTASLYLYVIWIMLATHIFTNLRVGNLFQQINHFKVILLLLSAIALVFIDR